MCVILIRNSEYLGVKQRFIVSWNKEMTFWVLSSFQILTSAENVGMSSRHQRWIINLLSCNLHVPEYSIEDIYLLCYTLNLSCFSYILFHNFL